MSLAAASDGLGTLAHARLFISGRYHLRFFASLGGIPPFFSASHAHKMGSLARVSEHDAHRRFSAFPDNSEIAEIVSSSRQFVQQGEARQGRTKRMAKLRLRPALLKGHMNG